jgi:hypothetical protein
MSSNDQHARPRTIRQQHRCDPNLPLIHSPMQRRSAILITRIDVRTCIIERTTAAERCEPLLESYQLPA